MNDIIIMMGSLFFFVLKFSIVTGRDGLKYYFNLLLVSLLQTPNEQYHHLFLAVDPLSLWPTVWY